MKATRARRRNPRHRQLKRNRPPGFWTGFRRATHTDQLRHRVGGATGRFVTRRINRRRVRKGKAAIPIMGDWFTLTPTSVGRKAKVPASRPIRAKVSAVKATKGQAQMKRAVAAQMRAKAKTAPAFSGPYVRASSGTLKTKPVPPGTISVGSSGVSGPGNRSAGPGIGVPAYGTGGAQGDDGHMISPGSARGSSTGTGWPATTPGGKTVTQTSGSDALTNVPETDAEYVAALRGLAGEVFRHANRLEEYQAALLEVVGLDVSSTRRYGAAAEHLSEAAMSIRGIVTDFLETYSGVIETAQKGIKIPGGEGRFFTGDVE